jgi:uncharacterized heparinase superfamily protein
MMNQRLVRARGDHPVTSFLKGWHRRWRYAGYASPFYALRLKGKHPLKLIASPDDPWPGRAARGAEILNGAFAFGGHSILAEDNDPWQKARHAPDLFKAWLYGFSWLRDLATVADQRRAFERAEGIMQTFIERYKTWDTYAWSPGVTGERLTSWMLHAPQILSSSNLVYRSAVLNALVRQARHLHRTARYAAPGLERTTALVGLILSGLLVPDGEARQKRGLKLLEKALSEDVMADGGVITRNARDAATMLRSLITLRRVMAELDFDCPEWLQITADRMVPFIRALRHGDGSLAHFGAAFGADGKDLDQLIDLSGARGRAMNNLPYVGYQRLKRQRTLVIMDVGPPPPPTHSHGFPASLGAIEMSDGKDRMIVNMGGTLHGFSGEHAALQWRARATRWHSAAQIDGANSASIIDDHLIGFKGVETLFERNENDEGLWVDLSHRCVEGVGNIQQSRRLFLNRQGSDFRGEDLISRTAPAWGGIFAGKAAFDATARFHLHPAIAISPTQDGSAIILRLPHGHGWLFKAKGGEISIEDSFYLDHPGAGQKASQIIVRAPLDAGGKTRFNWSFRRMDSRD